MSDKCAAPIDKDTQTRLLRYFNADVPSDGEVCGDTPINQAPAAAQSSGAAPFWSNIARNLLEACSFREMFHTSQVYAGNTRSEFVSVVLIEILKPGYAGTCWYPAKKLEVLVSLTRCETPGHVPPFETAAHVHVLVSNRLQPVLLANLSLARLFAGHNLNSYIAKVGFGTKPASCISVWLRAHGSFLGFVRETPRRGRQKRKARSRGLCAVYKVISRPGFVLLG